jgi:peptidoglycan/xylan/chitin deacetylase (PgdA/CDA1 family)
MRRAIDELLSVCHEFDARPTMFVTAVLIDRYPEFFRSLAVSRAELGVHGFVHTDHALLDENAQHEHLERALENFAKLRLAPKGFRHPYLRYNDETWTAAARLGFTHSSNTSVSWDVVSESLPVSALAAYARGLELYGAQPHSRLPSVPVFVEGGILDVPASLPDDEAVIDRLGLSGRDAGRFWLGILERSYEAGEVMTIVVHNERVPMCADSLRAVLRNARGRTPKVWVATIGEINEWWRKRVTYRLHVTSEGRGRWRVVPPADPEATVLVRSGETEPAGQRWFGDWVLMPRGPFVVSSEAPPEEVGDDESPSLNGSPQLRLGRWPGAARSVLTISSDVDAMSLVDFLRRPLEV